MTKINFLFLWLIFVYKFQIKLTLSVVIDAILAFFNHPVVHKDLKFKKTKLPFALLTIVVLIDWKLLIYSERIAAENKYVESENKQIIPSLIDFMTCRFYTVILSRNGSTAVPISHSKLGLKACLQKKGVVRRLFGSILISYTSEVS